MAPPSRFSLELELVDGTIADQLADAVVIAAPARSGSEQRNLFGEAERIAARAASASTRRQYASIFRVQTRGTIDCSCAGYAEFGITGFMFPSGVNDVPALGIAVVDMYATS